MFLFPGFAAVCWVLVVCVGIGFDLVWWFKEVAGCFDVMDLANKCGSGLMRTHVAPDRRLFGGLQHLVFAGLLRLLGCCHLFLVMAT